MESYRLTISDWSAFSPDRVSPADWRQWANGASALAVDAPVRAELPWVSAMLRRRLSPMGKAALWAAGQLLSQDRPQPLATVFASRHGEVARTVKLLRDLADDAPLSPASFSLSVHNAIGGIHSIASDVVTPITAISAGPDTLSAALLEAYTQLSVTGTGGEVLVVYYDDPLPAPLDGFDGSSSQVQALAMRVSISADGMPLSFSLTGAGDTLSAGPGPEADCFLRFLLRDEQSELTVAGDNRHWRWCKQSQGGA